MSIHSDASSAAAPLLVATGFRKSFHGVEVLHGVDFTLRRGEIHGIVGQNGAGKSTLMKILSGAYQRDAGETLIDGAAVRYDTPLGARRHGIAMVFQEFSLIPTMTVAQNVLLTREPQRAMGLIDEAAVHRRVGQVLGQLDVQVDPDAVVGDLPVGARQLVEVAKAVSHEARILILDEPTASLPAGEVATLFAALRRLVPEGIGIVYISHHLQEVLTICDRVTVLRDGSVTLSAPAADLSLGDIIKAMLGQVLERDLAWQPHAIPVGADPVLRVRGLVTNRVRDVSFELYPGEVVGVAGLLGSGRTELLRALFGLDRLRAGQVELEGKVINLRSPQVALRAGLALVPEDRRRAGLVQGHDVKANVLMAVWSRISRGGFVLDRLGERMVRGFVDQLKILTPSIRQTVNRLSGGNQQKVVVAKTLSVRPRVLLLDDPTVGIDVKSKADILDEVRKLASEGNAILFVSSELEQLSALSDRVMVMRDGAIARWLDRAGGDDLSEVALTHAIQGA